MNEVFNFLLFLYRRIFLFFDWISNKRHWLIYTMLFATIISLFTSFPRKEIILNNYSDVPEVVAVKEKIAKPFMPQNYGHGSHQAKLSFRLTVPIIAHYLGIGFGGTKILEFICGVLLFGFSALLVFKITDDKISSIISAFLCASIFVGTTSFVEFRGMFDGIAVFLLICALYSKKYFNVLIFVTLASWTDERGLIASSFILLFHLLPNNKNEELNLKQLLKSFHNSAVYGCLSAWIFYFILRYSLVAYVGLRTDTGGINLFFNHLNNLFSGVWSGLEGGWIIPVLAIVYLILKRYYSYLMLFCFALCVIIVVSISVCDITRSMAYLYPAFFIGLKLLSRSETIEIIRKYLFTALIISVIWPSYYFGGKGLIWWHSPPLPIQIIRSFIFNK